MPINPDTIVSGVRFVGIGFSLAATVVAALWAGSWLDERWGTSPLFLMLFLVGGLFGFTRRLLWMLREGKVGNREPETGNRELGKDGDGRPGGG